MTCDSGLRGSRGVDEQAVRKSLMAWMSSGSLAVFLSVCENVALGAVSKAVARLARVIAVTLLVSRDERMKDERRAL